MFWKKFFIAIGILIILVFIAQLIAAPYVKDLITKKATDALGVGVSIDNCAISILKGKIVLENIDIPSPQYKDEHLIKAKELSIDLYLTLLLFKKRALQNLTLIQPELVLHRDATGTLQLPQFDVASGKEVAKESKFEIFIKSLIVRNGSLKLIDHLVSTPPTVITFSNLNCDIQNSLSFVEKRLSTHLNMKGTVEGQGSFSINGAGNFISKPRSFEGDIKIENLSLPKFTPYYGKNLSIIVKKGNLYLDSKAICDKENLDVTNIAKIENVEVEPIGDPSQTILFEQPTIYVIEYFKDKKGTIGPFEFKIVGNSEKPEFRLGPEIERALKQAMMRRISEGVQQLLKEPQKAGEKIEEIGKVIGGEAQEKAKQIKEKLEEILGN